MAEVSESASVRTIEDLQKLVGQELALGPWFEMTQERINAFADVTGDHQYIHVDPQRAAHTPFGGTIAHGYLVLSLLPLLREGAEGVSLELGERLAVNYGLNKVRFVSPVRAGKRIRVRVKLLALEEVEPKICQLIRQQTVEIEDESRPAMVADTITRLYL